MKTLKGNLIGAFVAAIIMSLMWLVSLPVLFVRAFVLVQLWGWFMVEGYGLKALSFAVAVGVLMIISFAHAGVSGLKTDPDKEIDEVLVEYGRSLMLSTFLSLVFLVAGWVLHSFLF